MRDRLFAGFRVRKLRLFGTVGNERTYDVSFVDDEGDLRGFSVVAGASASGKSSVIDYVMYCLGADEYPDHEEMKANVSSAAIEVELSGVIHTIERTTVGSPSKFASVWSASLDDLAESKEVRKPIEPPSDADSLSQFLLSTFGLGDIKLPVSPSKADSSLAALSIRDMFRIIFFSNSRLDNENLVLENGNPFVALKLQQSIDLVFGVANESIADLAQRIQAAERAEKEAEKAAQALRQIVEDEYPEGPAGVEIQSGDARVAEARFAEEIVGLDQGAMQHQAATQGLRSRLRDAEQELNEWDIRTKNRASLIDRLSSLAHQYADDKRKLLFLKQSERLFDPLQLTHCPACLSELETAPSIDHGKCTLCGHSAVEASDGQHGADGSSVGLAGKSAIADRELAATTRRLEQLSEYLETLTTEYRSFLDARGRIATRAADAAHQLNSLVDLPAPYLAERDSLTQRRSLSAAEVARTELGIRLWERVEEADKTHALRRGQTTLLRRERRDVGDRPDRSAVIKRLSDRFASILGDFQYPKLSDAWLDDKLIPHVRGAIYTKASSGGLTLISIAWALALTEIGYEDNANSPGLLVIDSPQKNLGATQTDPEFRDAQLVEHLYDHVLTWLSNAGNGAQIIFVDNSPPLIAADDIVVRFSGDPAVFPYGLIDNATA